MGRSPCCDKVGMKKGPWTPEEDQKLLAYIEENGHGSWRALPSKAGLQRCGKSCRLRWTNYLRPDIKRGKFSLQEEQTIIQLHALLGNRWSAIATHLPKRTDNEIKNYWNTHLKKRLSKMGIDPVTHKPKKDTPGLTNNNNNNNNSKTAANLSHMAQWESARLEAEARLVRQSKLLSLHSAMNIIKPEEPQPQPQPQHQHVWADQLAISCCTSIVDVVVGAGDHGGPWTPPSPNDNHNNSSNINEDGTTCAANNYQQDDDDGDDSVVEEGFINLLLSADHHHHQQQQDDIIINNHNHNNDNDDDGGEAGSSINCDNNVRAVEEMKQHQDSASTTDNNSGRRTSTCPTITTTTAAADHHDEDCCYQIQEEEDIHNKNYWNTILNLVDPSSPSTHHHHTPPGSIF